MVGTPLQLGQRGHLGWTALSLAQSLVQAEGLFQGPPGVSCQV